MRISVLIVLCLLLIGCSKSKEINIVYSSDIWGETSHCGCPGHPVGGIARKFSFIKEVRRYHRGVYYFEIGDTFFKPGINNEQIKSEIPKVDMYISIFNRMGLDVFVPGEVDLLAGVDYLRDRLAKQKFRVVLSNLTKKGAKDTVFDRYFVDKRYGYKICVFGLISPELYKSEVYEILDPVAVARDLLNEFKKSRCDFNVLLSHLGYNEDIKLLAEIPDSGLSLLIGSHDGGWMSSPRRDGDVIVVYGYRRGQAVGHIGFVGSLNIRMMKDATRIVENKKTIAKLERELLSIIKPAGENDPEEFFKNDSNTLFKIRMLKEQIVELKKNAEINPATAYYFNRMVSMDSMYEDDKEIEEIVKKAESNFVR
ncbi:MAG: hypothetical protein N2746_05565 [Deltaproteobacteria bacterium]|nr:hypothetical protein [Deltaproteobacteria bacterium]